VSKLGSILPGKLRLKFLGGRHFDHRVLSQAKKKILTLKIFDKIAAILSKKRSRRCALSRAKRTSATPLEVKIFEIFGGPLIFRRKDPCRIKKGEKKVHFCRFFLFFASKIFCKIAQFCRNKNSEN